MDDKLLCPTLLVILWPYPLLSEIKSFLFTLPKILKTSTILCPEF